MTDTNKTAHTPGPWALIIDGTCSGAWPHIVPDGTSVEDCGELAIAELPSTHAERNTKGFPGPFSEKPDRFKVTDGHDEIMANARLIAAAPELLEALQLAGMSAGFQYMTYETQELINTAIAKATGAPA